MRYLIAMLFAVIGAAVCTFFVSAPAASAIVARFTFESPDEVADLHSLLFMLLNFVGLVLGWGIGWLIGAVTVAPQRPI